jgi:beta-phosphoglucomutase-like phosphatase (HAD superfamily)
MPNEPESCIAMGKKMKTTHKIRLIIWETGGILKPTGKSLDSLTEFIVALRPDYRTALLGKSWVDLRRVMVQYWGLIGAFDTLLLNVSTLPVADAPQLYLQAAASLRAQPGETVVIGSSNEEVIGAKGVGLHAICFETPAQVGSDLLEMLWRNS